MKKLVALMYVASLGVGFGAYALYLGYNTILIGGVMGFLGTIAGYIVRGYVKEKKSEEETE